MAGVPVFAHPGIPPPGDTPWGCLLIQKKFEQSMWVFLGGRILRKNLGIKSIKTNSWNQWRPIPGMQLHKYSKVHLNMHVTLRYAPNFIHKEKNIWKNIWLSASPEGYVSDSLTSTGMRLLQTWMCFCFENLQGKIFQDCSKDPVEGSNELKKTSWLHCVIRYYEIEDSMHFLNLSKIYFIC